MPELPEVEALAHHLREHALYRPVARVDVASMSAVKTYRPPMSALRGRVVTGAARYGKFLAVEFVDRSDEPLHLITHLSRAGWLRWHDTAATTPPKPGKGPLELRVHLDEVGGPGFDLTEAGTKRSLAAYLVTDPKTVLGVARLGPDALAADRETFAARIRSRRRQLKGVLTDQEILAGIGNAYSDEILHAAKLSPFRMTSSITDDEVRTLHRASIATLTRYTQTLRDEVGDGFPDKVTAFRPEMAVHGKYGQPCPVCGTKVQRIVYADNEANYCPTCQTEGRLLADRSLSRLLKDDWPRTLEELEERRRAKP